jgi:hypothetical protein
VSPLRLLDWMAVLGIEADEGVQYLMYRPPFGFGRFEARLWTRLRTALQQSRLPIGGVYYLLGRKSVAGMTPLRLVRSLRRANLAPAAVPRPTSRSPR